MANEYLKRTPTSSGNEKVWTLSAWIKTNDTSNTNYLFGYFDENASPTPRGTIQFNESNIDGKTTVGWNPTGSSWYQTQTEGDHRDPGNWLHLCIAVDTTKTDEGDGIRMYFNGAKESATSYLGTWGSGAAALNVDTGFNRASIEHYINAFRVIGGYGKVEYSDFFWVDGQALTPEVFGFYKEGDGYVSAGSTMSTDFRPGQWVPKRPRIIKTEIERRGGFGVNGFYLPMNDSSNPGADFHTTPNSIITLKGEDLPQPQNGAPTTTDSYVSQLREEVGTLGFDGCVKIDADGDYLTVPSSSDFAYGTGDFTWEAFVFSSSLSSDGSSANYLFDHGSDGGVIQFYNGLIRYYNSTTGTSGNLYTKGGGLKNSTWHHVAVARQSGTTRLFVDGQLRTSQADTHNYSALAVTIGDYGAHTGTNEWDGFISNVRIIKGTALYTANFTAPTEPLTNVTNTVLLCCNSSTSATAATVTPGTITANGDVLATRNELTGSISLAVPGISTATGSNLITNGTFDTNITGWTATDNTQSWDNGQLQITRSGGGGATSYQTFTTVSGQRYTVSGTVNSSGSRGDIRVYDGTGFGGTTLLSLSGTASQTKNLTGSFTASSTTSTLGLSVDNNNTTIYVDNIVVKQEDAPRDYSADIKGSGSNKTLTPNGGAGVGYELGNYYGSAMTFDGNGDYLTHASNSDFAFGTDDFTVEFWMKRTDSGTNTGLLDTRTTNTDVNGWFIRFTNSTTIGLVDNGDQYATLTHSGDWNHIAFVRDSNVITGYVNGVAGDVSTDVTADFTSSNFLFGGFTDTQTSPNAYAGQIQDLRIYKGVAKYKGGFDVPKPYTPVGIESWRTVSDCTANNFATLNPLKKTDMILSEGNLKAESSDTYSHSVSTIGASTGKYYWETTPLLASGGGNGVGLATPNTDSTTYLGVGLDFSYSGAGTIYGPGDTTTQTGLATFTVGDVIGVAMNLDSSSVTFYKNGTSAATVSLTSGETYFAAVADQSGGGDADFALNFGQNPSFGGRVTAGTFTDSNGKGLFKYEPPSGFLALCEDNLPTPAIADPGKYFKTVLYTGDGNDGRSITGVGFKPDFVWIKRRASGNQSHAWHDSVRGPTIHLGSSDTDGDETNNVYGALNSFDNDGFSIALGSGGGGDYVNSNNNTHVAWCWKAGGAAVANNDGTITSQVSANQDAGFSIVSTNGSGTAGHGLNATPQFIISKRNAAASEWSIQHHKMMTSSTGKLLFSTAGVVASSTPYMFNANDTTFEPIYTDPCISYCWTEIEGYSKFGSYTGNGSTDGPFVYCGFKPAWVMVKNTSATSDWRIYDSSRVSTNPNNLVLYPNLTDVDTTTAHPFDLLSNGFKIRGDFNDVNTSAHTYIFMAFAESPFQTANAK